MSVRTFWVCVMECMYAQTGPQFIFSSKRALGNGVITHVNCKGKTPPPEAQRRVEPAMLHHAGSRAQHTTHWAIPTPPCNLSSFTPASAFLSISALAFLHDVVLCFHCLTAVFAYSPAFFHYPLQPGSLPEVGMWLTALTVTNPKNLNMKTSRAVAGKQN